MFTVKKHLATNNYVKIENKLFALHSSILSDGGKVLYGFLATMRPGQRCDDAYLIGSLGISKRSLSKYKKELGKIGLIWIERIGRNAYDLYLGTLVHDAWDVKSYWDVINNTEGKPITLEDVKNMKKPLTVEDR